MANGRGRGDEEQRRWELDHKVAKDPDIRGATKGRLGRQDDVRHPNENSPDKHERKMKRGRG